VISGHEPGKTAGTEKGRDRLPLIRATEPTKDRLSAILARVMSREEWIACHGRYALAS
jgi:hypothetical protein